MPPTHTFALFVIHGSDACLTPEDTAAMPENRTGPEECITSQNTFPFASVLLKLLRISQSGFAIKKKT